jgi:hypothetical protein
MIVFIGQFILPAGVLSGPDLPITQIKVGAGPSDNFFKEIYESVCVGLSIYKMDVIEKYTKEKITTDFRAGHGRAGCGKSVRFDLKNIDIGKKGWTRYYPFSIGNKDFLMRIFLTSELHYQPNVKVLYEGSLRDPAVTFQVLPSLGELLSDCNIKPFKTYPTSQVDRSS